jgi:hypothetical protein
MLSLYAITTTLTMRRAFPFKKALTYPNTFFGVCRPTTTENVQIKHTTPSSPFPYLYVLGIYDMEYEKYPKKAFTFGYK